MKISKLKIQKNKLDVNLKLYFFLKELNGSIKISDKDIDNLLEAYFANKHLSHSKIKAILLNVIENFSSKKKIGIITLMFQIDNEIDLSLFIFSIKLIQIKTLLLAEAKLGEIADLVSLKNVNQLSIQYDTISKNKPYLTRVNGALLSLLFFSKLEEKDTHFISQSTEEYIVSLFKEYEYLRLKGVEPNQMFMLMFSESINQSIVSDAGSSYEDRIYNILIGIGIPEKSIEKVHDKVDKSTEFDFFFELEGKTYGIGAKRTLRERYKQFIKTSQMSKIDAMIQITLGLDLTEEKAKSIAQYGVITFVSDEIYSSKKYLQELDMVYPASALNLNLLKKLAK